MTEEFNVELTTAVYGGDCLGRLPDGRAVFVPFAMPGERVRVRLVEEKRGHARAELLEVDKPASQRRTPRCRHFGLCGGCHYQHIPYAEQLAMKTAILRDQLERIGGMHAPPVEACVPAPQEFNYRNYIQFHLTAEGLPGYFQADGRQVFAVEECLLPEAALDGLWPQLQFESEAGISRVGLRAGLEEDVQIILESEDLQAPEISVDELPVSITHVSPAGSLVLAGSPGLFLQVAERIFRVSAASFFQVNTAMAEALVGYVCLQAKLDLTQTVLDVYCGVGLFSAFLAEQAGRLVGIEASTSACEDFVFNLDAFEHVELYEAPAEQVLPVLQIKPDLILVDPPRAGIARKALDGILALGAPRLIYISCDPATLARDARRLVEGGYRLRSVRPFDLFPQTFHIESVSVWER